jgi:hypothetical protein
MAVPHLPQDCALAPPQASPTKSSGAMTELGAPPSGASPTTPPTTVPMVLPQTGTVAVLAGHVLLSTTFSSSPLPRRSHTRAGSVMRPVEKLQPAGPMSSGTKQPSAPQAPGPPNANLNATLSCCASRSGFRSNEQVSSSSASLAVSKQCATSKQFAVPASDLPRVGSYLGRSGSLTAGSPHVPSMQVWPSLHVDRPSASTFPSHRKLSGMRSVAQRVDGMDVIAERSMRGWLPLNAVTRTVAGCGLPGYATRNSAGNGKAAAPTACSSCSSERLPCATSTMIRSKSFGADRSLSTDTTKPLLKGRVSTEQPAASSAHVSARVSQSQARERACVRSTRPRDGDVIETPMLRTPPRRVPR